MPKFQLKIRPEQDLNNQQVLKNKTAEKKAKRSNKKLLRPISVTDLM